MLLKHKWKKNTRSQFKGKTISSNQLECFLHNLSIFFFKSGSLKILLKESFYLADGRVLTQLNAKDNSKLSEEISTEMLQNSENNTSEWTFTLIELIKNDYMNLDCICLMKQILARK